MKISIISVGKIKESFYREAIAEYSKRLSSYCKFQIIEVADEKTPDNASDVEVALIKEKEGQRIKKYIDEKAFVIALAIEGKQFDSIAFADKLEQLMIDGNSHIIFIIGGSLGLDPSILKGADLLLSFSKMTFPHQLMRVVLSEQIYRAFRIIQNEPYHK